MNINENGRGRGSKYGDRSVITAAEEQEAASVKENRGSKGRVECSKRAIGLKIWPESESPVSKFTV